MRSRDWRRHQNIRVVQKRKGTLKAKYVKYKLIDDYQEPGYMRKARSKAIYICRCGICTCRSISYLNNFTVEDIIGEYDECNFTREVEGSISEDAKAGCS
jgi:hypothetical protein